MSQSEFPSSAVREMPEGDRPRERLVQVGAEVMKDSELLAILFRTGTAKIGAVALAENVMKHFGSLRKLSRASLTEIQQVNGVGPVKAIEIKAALELGKRLAVTNVVREKRIKSAADAAAHLMWRFKEYETEHFKSLLLNTKNEVLDIVDVSSGSINGTLAVPNDVFRKAVREGAMGVIVAHNHPSGDPEPSRQDIELTKRLAAAGEILGISLLDHMIFGEGRYVSLKERQLM